MALHHKVKLDFAYERVPRTVDRAKHSHRSQPLKIETPAMIGNNCRIGARVQIEAGTASLATMSPLALTPT